MADGGTCVFKAPRVREGVLTGKPAYRATVFWPEFVDGEERLKPRLGCRVGGSAKPSTSSVYFLRDEPIAGVAWKYPGRPVYKPSLPPLSAFGGHLDAWRKAWMDEGVPERVVESVGERDSNIRYVRSAICLGIQVAPIEMVVCIESLWEHGFGDDCFSQLDADLMLDRTNLLCKMEFRGLQLPPRHSHSIVVPKGSHVSSPTDRPEAPASPASKIFLVHGRNRVVRDDIDLFLLKELGLTTKVMSNEAEHGRTLPEKFEEIANECAFAVFILTADDHFTVDTPSVLDPERPKKERRTPVKVSRARQNVLLELGYFWGRLGRRGRIAVLLEQGLDLPSDIKGFSTIALTADRGETKRHLREELESAGILPRPLRAP